MMTNQLSLFGYNRQASPLTHYAGGKRRLLSFIRQNMPSDYANYFEPFCGGLTVYCFLVNSYWTDKSYWISDLNPSLIRVYQHIKTHPDEMFDMLSNYYSNWSPKHWHQTNYLPRKDETDLELAGRYWYLLRHAYSNKSAGGGSIWLVSGAKTIYIPTYSYTATMALSTAFNETDTTIKECDYQLILERVMPRDFIYLDPPYLDANRTNYYNMLTLEQHQQLADFAWELSNRGAYVMISNYDNKETRKLYEGMRFRSRSLVNTMTNNGRRHWVKELLAMTY